jgi:hypothetical protein
MYFGWVCERAGIKHHCDTSLVIPHATVAWVDNEAHDAFLNVHPELLSGKTIPTGVR